QGRVDPRRTVEPGVGRQAHAGHPGVRRRQLVPDGGRHRVSREGVQEDRADGRPVRVRDHRRRSRSREAGSLMLSAADRYIYAGRLLNYLDKPDKAVAMFTEGLAASPDEPRLLRHRGHRYITVRRYRDAVTDLKRAA